MMKHLFWYPWIMGLLVLGIAVCAGLIIYALFFRAPLPAVYAGAQLVKEAIKYAPI